MSRRSSPRPNKRLLSPEQHDWLAVRVKNQSRRELCDLLDAAFGVRLTEKQMHAYLKNHHIGTGRDTRFKPGVVSHKPPKGVHYSPATEFKPGQMPHNHKPVGTERISKDGYIEVKVSEPKKWRAKHVVIWEQMHGPKPKNSAVIFLDNDKTNLDPDNLLLVSRHTLLVANRLGLLSKDADVSRAGIAVGNLIAEIEHRQKDFRERVSTRKGATS